LFFGNSTFWVITIPWQARKDIKLKFKRFLSRESMHGQRTVLNASPRKHG